jgi:hypothetical protein
MDLDKELHDMRQRLSRGIERNYLIGMAHLEGMTPREYAAKLDKERLEAARVVFKNGAEALGAAYRTLFESLREAAESFARGWQQLNGGR